MAIDIATKQDIDKLSDKIDRLLNNLPQSKWILTRKEVRQLTGWSETLINKKIEEGSLNPWQESPGTNSKTQFYAKEVMSQIPSDLIDKYGKPA